MTPQDREKVEKFFNNAWNIYESLDSFLKHAGLTQADLNRLCRSKVFRRLCRRMTGGLAVRRELEIGRAGMEAATRMSKFVAGFESEKSFNETARKTYSEAIKLARAEEARAERAERAARQAEADRGAAADTPLAPMQLTKPERVAVIRKLLESAEGSSE